MPKLIPITRPVFPNEYLKACLFNLQTDAEQTSLNIKQNFGDKPILDSLGE